jgi:alanine-synthesizing transaminase
MASLSTDVLTLTFNSLSKSYRSCGYRAGWMVVSGDKRPPRLHRGPEHALQHALCSNVPGQWAIQTALGGYQSINDLVGEGGRLRRQRDLAYELITAIPGVSCVKPQAALYMFPAPGPEMYPIEPTTASSFWTAARNQGDAGAGHRASTTPTPDHFRIVFPAARGRPARGHWPHGQASWSTTASAPRTIA